MTWTKEEISRRFAGLREKAAESFLRDGHGQTSAFLFATKPSKAIVEIGADPLFSDEIKGAFAGWLRRLAEEHEAVAIALVCEAWSLTGPSAAAHDMSTSISTHAERQEVMVSTLESHRFPYEAWQAIISRHGDEVVLGPWEDMGWANEQRRDGRLANLLPVTS